MIRPLRQRHRVTIGALGVLLPAAFAAGLVARKPVPVAGTVPPGIAAAGADVFGRALWTKADLWPGQRIVTRLLRATTGSMAVELQFRDLARPDVLVYWAPEGASALERLPDEARLVGALSNRSPIPLPAAVRGETGRFVLYSLADHEVVAVSNPVLVERN